MYVHRCMRAVAYFLGFDMDGNLGRMVMGLYPPLESAMRGRDRVGSNLEIEDISVCTSSAYEQVDGVLDIFTH